MQKRKVSRAPYVITGIVLGLYYGVLIVWSMYRKPLLEMYPSLTAGDLSIVFSIHNLVVAAGIFSSGFLQKFISPRTIIRIAAVLIGGGMIGLSFLPEGNDALAFKMLILCFSICSAYGVGLNGSTANTTLVLWFPERLGMMNGLIMVAYGMASVIFGAIVTVMLPTQGLLMIFRVFGISAIVLMLAVSHWCVRPGPDIDLPEIPSFEANRGDKNFTVGEIFRSPVFWTFILFCFCIKGAGLTFSDHAASISQAFGLAAIFGLVYSPASALASISCGLALNKLGVERMLILLSSILIGSCSLMILANYTSVAAFMLIGLIGVGICFGAANGTTGAVLRITFGEANYPRAYSLSSISIVLSAGMGIICGRILDWMNNGFIGVFIFILIFALLSMVCAVLLRGFVRKKNAADAAAAKGNKGE